MKSIKNLKQKLQKINSILSNIKETSTMEEISVVQFLKLKHYIKLKKKITKEIKLVERFAKGCELLYEYDTRRWIDDPRINCRKYCKLEAKARYNRDLKLYKCGVLAKRPVLPILQNLMSYIQNKEFIKNVFFRKIRSIKLPQEGRKFNMNFANAVVPNTITSSHISINEINVKKFRESLKFNPESVNTATTKKDVGSIRIGKKRAALDVGFK